MKIKLFFLIVLLPQLLTAQILPEHTEEIKLPNTATRTITINQPIDTVYPFLCSSGYLNLKAEKQVPHEIETVITEVHTFTDKEEYEAYKKAGKEFYNVYSFNVPARWKLSLKAVNDHQTTVGFQLLSYYLDSTDYNYQYAKTYKNYKEIVSNGNIEGLTEIYARQHFAGAPIASVPFSREKGYDNLSYQYRHFIPGRSFKETGIWNKPVPELKQAAAAEPGFILYAKSAGVVYSVNEKKLIVNWQQTIPFIPKNQNHNDFTLYHGIVYVVSNKGNLSSINAATGELYWQCNPMGNSGKEQTSFFGQKAPVSDSLVYVNDNKYIYAVDRFTGKVRWSQQHGGYGHYNYSTDGRYVYKSGILELFQIDKQNGEVHKIINSTQANTFYYPNLLQDNGRLILCDGDTYGYDLKKDKILWTKEYAYDHILQSEDGKSCYLNVSADEQSIISIDPGTGDILWTCKLPLKADEYGAILDFQQHKGQLCILAGINKKSGDKSTAYRLVVINETQGKVVQNQLLNSRAISNLMINNQTICLLTLNGYTLFNRKDGTLSERKFATGALVPDDDYTLNHIERVPAE
jgi:outer membrane protein assembly factor BamB